MSLNDGFWSLWQSPWNEGYRMGDRVLADLERDIEIGREMRRADPRVFDLPPWSAERKRIEQLATRRVYARQLVELGCVDLGGEAG